ncbi:MAG TPA: potassium-transporting ATPase subunit KdpA [Armatimonadetes bacterium]|jgi:K+-transporting ATPase ATPase A chain|nr:potassium-transporting ATPase subunit KdpA [Armatimonadota bacterium]
MTSAHLAELLALAVLVVVLGRPLGRYMASVYDGNGRSLPWGLRSVERAIYAVTGIDAEREMGWREYARAMAVFTLAGAGILYAMLRLQSYLPLNPTGTASVRPWLALNTAISFATNTNWQSYAGEQVMSYCSQALGLTVQNFLSAAAGMAVLVALIRGIRRTGTGLLGNFYVDLTRSVAYILLPLAVLCSLLLISQGAVQTWAGPAVAHQVDDTLAQTQRIARGPVASQVAIKQLGSNGGGFFGANSAHPFENPTPLTNFVETLCILLIPVACCFLYGEMVGDRRQAWMLFGVMVLLYVTAATVTVRAELAGDPVLASHGVSQASADLSPGGNMEGKEVRNGIVMSAVWATATTATSNGSVNSMHASYTPIGLMAPLLLMQVGEVVFGGVGSGLYGMLAIVVVAVFVAGLMIGRTPEYLGKKIGIFETQMASVIILLPPVLVLAGTALALSIPSAAAAMHNSGPRGFTEVLYAFTSAGNNNGSALAGLGTDTPFYNCTQALAMLVGRIIPAVAALALGGALARKQPTRPGPGTLATHTPLFALWLVFIVLGVGALTFLPAVSLGPLAEHFVSGGRW